MNDLMSQARDIFRVIGMNLYGKTSTPKKRSSCPKDVKETVWRKYFGNKMSGKCYVCGKAINFTDFEVGHNKPFTKGGKWNINNLRPICRTSNRTMGTMSIEAFKRKYFAKKRVVKRKKTGRKRKGRKRESKKRTRGYYIDPLTGRKVPLPRIPW